MLANAGKLVSASARPDAGSVLSLIWGYKEKLLLLCDILVVFCSFMLAYYLRFDLDFLAILNPESAGDAHQYINGAAFLTAVWVYLIGRDGGYELGLRGIIAPMIRSRTLVKNGLHAMVVLIVVSFIFRDVPLSRAVYALSGVIAIPMTILVRSIFRTVDRAMAKNGIIFKRVAIIGMSEVTKRFAKSMQDNWHGGYLTGHISWSKNEPRKLFEGEQVLGYLDQINEIYKKNPFDILIMPSPEMTYKNGKRRGDIQGPGTTYSNTIMKIINFCEAHNIDLYMLPGSYEVAVSKYEIASFSEMPLIRLQDALIHPFYSTVKRLVDVCVSSALIMLGMPLWIAIALFIKSGSKGPIFFTQIRAGLHGKPFKMYKFRSMVEDAEAKLGGMVDIDKLDEPVFKIKNDPRITTVGRFLRRTSLDETPQLLNVLKGEMSIVGPRPEELALVEKYDHQQRRRLKGLPGITGYQQINNRGEPSLSRRIKYDLIYLKHQGPTLDSYIILKTIWVVIRSKGLTS